jgi:uncharacterized protein (DUF952 family)
VSSRPQVIHHLTPGSELRTGCTSDAYAPARLSEDGFVHCSGSVEVTLAVARDYFAELDESLFVLTIDPSKLRAELRFEAPTPIPDAGRDHLEGTEKFPHVYGPIEREAIRAVGRLERHGGRYHWPERFRSLDATLDSL